MPTSSRKISQNWVDCSQSVTSQNPVGRTFSGIAYGNGKLVYFGGGHGSYSGNDVELFDVASQAWTQQYNPECPPACCQKPGICSNAATACKTNADCSGGGTCEKRCATTGTTCTTDADCGGYACGTDACYPAPANPSCCTIATNCACWISAGWGTTELTPLSRPYTEHTYQQFAYDATQGKWVFFLKAGTWSYDASTKTWTLLTSAGTGPNLAGYTLEYDADLGTVLLFSATNSGAGTAAVYRFNWSTNTWVKHGPWTPPDTYNFNAAYLSTYHQHLVSAYHGMWRYDGRDAAHGGAGTEPNAGTWVQITNVPSALQHNTDIGYWASSYDYDPVNDMVIFVMVHPGLPLTGLDTWAYYPASNTFQQLNPATAPSLNGGAPAYQQMLRYAPTTGTFYFLDVGNGGSGGRGGTPDTQVSTWTFRYAAPNTPAPTPTGPTSTPTQPATPAPAMPTASPTRASAVTATIPPTPATTAAPTPASTVSSAVSPTPAITPAGGTTPTVPTGTVISWSQRAAQSGVLAAISFHSQNDVATYGSVGFSGLGPTYDATMNAAKLPVINDYTHSQFNKLDTGAFGGQLVYSLPWAQQFDENSEFEVQFLFRDDDWVTEPSAKKLAIWSAGDRNPSSPSVSAGPTQSGSCMPNDVVIEASAGYNMVNWNFVTGYQGCSSGPAWGQAFAQQIGVDFNAFSPPRDEYWWQPAVPSCLHSRWIAGTPGICTAIGANVWQALTMHVILGPRGAGPFGGATDWFTNSYFWLAFGWEGRPSRALVYRGPFKYYSPISDTSYGTPPPKIGKIWLFPYRQNSYWPVSVTSSTSTTLAGIGWGDVKWNPSVWPAGTSVTDPYGGYTTLTQDAHPGDTTLYVSDTSSFHQPITQVRLWRQMQGGNRWYKELIIATGGALADPFGTAPIVWPTPPNSASAWPGLTAPPSGETAAVPATRPTPPVMLQ